jgi:hypothetical protein
MSRNAKQKVLDPRTEAEEAAPEVWPPAERDSAPVGHDRAASYLEPRIVFESDDDLARQTANVTVYSRETAMPRLIDALRRLPSDFFSILESGRRDVRFHVQPVLSASSPPLAEVRPSGPGDRRTYVVFLRGALELDDVVLRAVLVHELCHVILDHKAPIAWPREPHELRRAAAEMENEALRLADEIGFKEETWVLRDIISDLAHERGVEGHVLPSGDIRLPKDERFSNDF